ncbi:MAG: hypothetical protein KDK70_17010 [Myxococcales bacterium]|nr:hypothetical protein [Myxococcales bacterium]
MKGDRRLAGLVLALGLGLGLGLAWPAPARAWDPSTTHQAMLERSALDSALHLRWMEASQLQRGLFSPLRLDPARLPKATRRLLMLAMRRAHAASGAQALGGPGACPGPSAPETTRAHCVEGDLWEMTALGWLELGVVVETVPAERLLHHFVDRRDPTALRWTDDDLPRAVLRHEHARAGGTVAARATGGSFEGSGRSVLAWLDDPADPWAPPALAEHLRRSLELDPVRPTEGRIPAQLVSCRGCNQYVHAHEHDCPHCGVELAAAAVAHERELERRHAVMETVRERLASLQ